MSSSNNIDLDIHKIKNIGKSIVNAIRVKKTTILIIPYLIIL